jgi:N-acetylglucosaminyl-diphospho-decaprenol L-rhamnosyltransferase
MGLHVRRVPPQGLVSSSGTHDRLGVVVVNYRSHELVEQNLGSAGLDALDATVVVVDNFSGPEERVAIERLASSRGWQLLEPSSNLGFGAGMNRGVERAIEHGCGRFLLVNPDVQIDATTVGALQEASASRPLTILTPRLRRPDGSMWFAGGQLDRRTGFTTNHPDSAQSGHDRWLTGACLMIDRGTWDRLGGFDEEFFLYWEDVDLSQRALEAGGDISVVHDIVATHSVGGTQPGEGKSPAYGYYNCRNRLLFAARHLPPSDRARWLWHAPRYAVRTMFLMGRRPALRRPMLMVESVRGSLVGAWIVLHSIIRDQMTPDLPRG